MTPDRPSAPPHPAASTPGSIVSRCPEWDAWHTEFFLENHLDPIAFPDRVATPEQVRFMVFTEGEERYYPCSDRMFNTIMNRKRSRFLRKRYAEVLAGVLDLIHRLIEEPFQRQYLETLLRIKYRHETRDQVMIPSRLEKRLLRIFLDRTQIEDPYMEEKELRNRRAARVLDSEACRQAVNRLNVADLGAIPPNLVDLKLRLRHLELQRLISLAVENSLWRSDGPDGGSAIDYEAICRRPLGGNGVVQFFDVLGIDSRRGKNDAPGPKKILWLADEAGEILVDLAIIKHLAGLGHKVVIAVKDGPLYTRVDIHDIQVDPVLKRELKDALFIRENALSKNDLFRVLMMDKHILVMSDGTHESLNLMLTSTSFARMFKEVDAIVSRGADQRRRLFDTRFRFTQDIFNISRGADGGARISFKPKHPAAVKFSYDDLENRARAIIERMAAAKKKGMTVIFYSGIIGSIPGRIKMAKKIMSVSIEYLKSQTAMTFFINPSEYFEAGMDADDLMYMWEIVQRSGHIDIWRFQTYSDIAKAFELMESRVPPEWVGKDATYSTGCTKEMAIAQEVQKKQPEMQIIGPSKERFMRRKDYGVGKMHDERLAIGPE